tara:strand:+ start:3367 stop:4341 length:975 start_codon:yes stop_codon:yes gene_type:complete
LNIVRVPFRVSLFGGGTDFKHFYSRKNATVISFTIDRYCYISLRQQPFFNTKYRLSWSKIEEVSNIKDLTHPSVRACLNYMGIKNPLEIHTVGDLPARSGLGSSSAFTSALLTALTLYKKKSFNASSIAKQTIYIEQEVLKENVGIQDQIQVCHGGFNITSIFKDSNYSILSLNNSSSVVKEISDSLVLVYSGITRTSSDIHDQIIRSDLKEKSLNTINSIAKSFSAKLTTHSASFEFFISLLKESWDAKSSTFPPSENTEILLSIYEKAISAGAKCGKLLGAGGGGFFAFFVPPSKQDQFTRDMSPNPCVIANISYSGIEKIL